MLKRYIDKYINKFKEMFNKKTEGNNKKNIENLVFFLVLLIITIIAINTIWSGDKKKEKENKDNIEKTNKVLADIDNSNIIEKDEYTLEEKLENILSNISGVGQVKVMVTYSQSSEIVPIYNESQTTSNTEEEDTNGGKRTITENNSNREVVMIDENGSKTLITSKTLNPKIEGAIVIAQGAKNINIKSDIVNAVSSVTGLPEYKVQVFEMK